MSRRFVWIGVAWFAAVAWAAPASAQIIQSAHLGVGGFFPRGFDSRDDDDTLVANLKAAEPLRFDIGRFRSGTIFGEWNVQFGHIEFGAGIGYYRDRVPSVYRNLVNNDGSEIEQDLRLRFIPMSAVVRFMPFGDPRTAQPYVGVGIGALRWRYSESGEFVDTSDNSIFIDRFVATGTDTGPLVLGGIRLPMGGDIYALTMEWRYQFGLGRTGGLSKGFLGRTIDLSGGNFNVGVLIRF
jgi:hypothetical protein